MRDMHFLKYMPHIAEALVSEAPLENMRVYRGSRGSRLSVSFPIKILIEFSIAHIRCASNDARCAHGICQLRDKISNCCEVILLIREY